MLCVSTITSVRPSHPGSITGRDRVDRHTGAQHGHCRSDFDGSDPVPIAPRTLLRLSAAEIAALLARGDRFLALGDIASARLFYEHAAEVGDGGAALKLAKTFDPVVLHFARLYGVRGDADLAAYWYRRARDLREAAPR